MAKYPQPIVVITIYFQAQGQQMSNVSFWAADTPPSNQTQMNQMAASASAAISAVYLPVLSKDADFLGVKCLYLNSGSSLEATSSSGAAKGTSNGTLLPDQTAVVIDKQTNQYGRQYLGRYFIGGIDTDSLNPLDSNSTGPNAVNASALESLAAFFGADKTFSPVLLHARHWDRKTNALIPIAKCVVRTRIASQRKRRRRTLDVSFSS